MKKDKIEIEHQLNSTSRNIIWQLLGTAHGLARWIADDVQLDGDTIVFAWGDDWRHHEVRKARVVAMARHSCIRWTWDDEDDGSYVEIRMEPNVLTGLYALHVTDFASADDRDWLCAVWSHNFERLHRNSGV